MTRPLCPTCGMPMRGSWIRFTRADASDAAREDTTRASCTLCWLDATSSQDVADDDAGHWGREGRAVQRGEWRGREGEANAWEWERVPAEFRRTLDGFDGAPLETRAVIERGLRPRAIVEEGPEPGSVGVPIVMTQALLWLSMQNTDAYGSADGPRADARVGHTSRDVPAFSVHDRYVVDNDTFSAPEPRAAYMQPNEESIAVWQMMQRAKQAESPSTAAAA